MAALPSAVQGVVAAKAVDASTTMLAVPKATASATRRPSRTTFVVMSRDTRASYGHPTDDFTFGQSRPPSRSYAPQCDPSGFRVAVQGFLSQGGRDVESSGADHRGGTRKVRRTPARRDIRETKGCVG